MNFMEMKGKTMIEYNCENCGESMHSPESLAYDVCPKCGHQNKVDDYREENLIHFVCPKCNQKITATKRDRYQKCPHCKNFIKVPGRPLPIPNDMPKALLRLFTIWVFVALIVIVAVANSRVDGEAALPAIAAVMSFSVLYLLFCIALYLHRIAQILRKCLKYNS